MVYFLLGWLTCLTIFILFRREIETINKQTPVETWNIKGTPETSIDTGFFQTGGAEFIKNDRVGEIIKGKEDVKLDDILI